MIHFFILFVWKLKYSEVQPGDKGDLAKKG
jgi:hypothetical protein